MIIDHKSLINSIATPINYNLYTDINENQQLESINIKTVSLLQSSQNTKLSESIKQRTLMTPNQLQRLQACVDKVTAILNEQTTVKERNMY